jgi:superfamily I DNA and RNA helicase
MHTYLSELNESQHLAVTAPDGPMLVVAGPGSGKTRVLTYRIAWLMEQGVPARDILTLTFTNPLSDRVRVSCGRVLFTAFLPESSAQKQRKSVTHRAFPFTIPKTPVACCGASSRKCSLIPAPIARLPFDPASPWPKAALLPRPIIEIMPK